MRRSLLSHIALVLVLGLLAGTTTAAAREHPNGGPRKGKKTATVQPSDTVADPTVTGPITGGARTGKPYGTTLIELPDNWVEEEFFIEGTARAADGSTAPYKTRILVRRPTAAQDFNGTAALDWVNVTIPDDTDVSWPPMARTIIERGFAYVAVSAQRLGVEASPIALKQWDPVRYGALSHPGDDYSFDIFSQASEALLDPKVLGDLRPYLQRRLALGASQSAGRLTTYVNNWQREAGVFDGFMPQISNPNNVNRDIAPVLWLNSQSEHNGTGSPPDSGLFRLWEVAGPAHTTNEYHEYVFSTYAYSQSNGAVNPYDAEHAGAWGYQGFGNTPAPSYGRCLTYNYYTVSYAWSAALVALDDWVRSGTAPAPMPRVERVDGTLQYDEHGNLAGGIRSPLLAAPIASYYAGSPPPGTGSDACAQMGGRMPLTGLTRVFAEDKLAALYPTPDDFLTQFETAITAGLDAGWILPEGARELRRRAQDAAAFVAAASG